MFIVEKQEKGQTVSQGKRKSWQLCLIQCREMLHTHIEHGSFTSWYMAQGLNSSAAQWKI